MKRKIFRSGIAVLLVLACGVPVSAARMLVPVGKVVGLKLSEGSVTVVAFDETVENPARDGGIRLGDEIVSVNEYPVDSAEDLHRALSCSDGSVTVELDRDGQRCQLRLSPAVTAEGPRLGVYVREGITGIGTVTWYDPAENTFGALGHGVSDRHGTVCAMTAGQVYAATVESIRAGQVGAPGQLRGSVTSMEPIGELNANTPFGIFGTGCPWQGEALPVAAPAEVTVGPAQILSNIHGNEIELYDVQIVKVYSPDQTTGRDMMLHITDPTLLETTGGIVAGMSGSPIIQDGKLVGAVTHVLVNQPDTGYGIFIENMLQAAG